MAIVNESGLLRWRASSMKSVIQESVDGVFSADSLPKGVSLPDHHTADEDHQRMNDDEDYGYRLNLAETIFYYVVKNTVVGHLAFDGNNQVVSVHVDSSARGQGYAKAMYLKAAQILGGISSDEQSAMEPGAKALWASLKAQYPDRVSLKAKRFHLS